MDGKLVYIEGGEMVDDSDRISGLEERVTRLESRLARMERYLDERFSWTAAPQPSTVAVTPSSVPQGTVLTPSPRQTTVPIAQPQPKKDKKPDRDLEQSIGRIWLPRVAMVLVSLAVLFLLTWAFDRIGAAARIGLGFLGGTLLMLAGLWAERRQYRPLSAGLIAAGSVVFYFCAYAGHALLGLLPRLPALVLMALITTATSLLAIRFRQQFVALMSLTGGFLAPVLLGRAGADQSYWWSLLAYLAVLDLGLLWLAHFRSWPYLAIIGFLATQGYLLYYGARLLALPPPVSLGVFAFFFLVFSMLALYRQLLRRESGDGYDLALIILNGLAVLGWALAVFYRHEALRDWPGLAALGVAAVHLLLGLGLLARGKSGRSVLLCFFGLTLACVTLAGPLQLQGNPLAFTWLAEAGLLIWLGTRLNHTGLRRVGLAVLGLSCLDVLILTTRLMFDHAMLPLWMPTGLLPLLGLAVLAALLPMIGRIGPKGGPILSGHIIFAGLVWTTLLSCQWWLGLSPALTGIDRSWLHFGLFLLWSALAVSFMLIRRSGGAALKAAAVTVLVIIAYKLAFNNGFHYFPLRRVEIWFDGYLLQALGGVGLVLSLGYLWPAGSADRTRMQGATATIAGVMLWIFLTLEYMTWPVWGPAFARGLGLSALWIVFAALMIAAGLRWQRRGPRLIGLALFGVALFKLAFFDLHWTGLYRVFSFLLGAMAAFLLGALYQKWGRGSLERDNQEATLGRD